MKPIRGNIMKTTGRAVVVVAALVTVGVLGGSTGGAAAATADSATLYLIQGLPGATIDVAVDGESVADDLGTTAVSGPIEVSAGTRTLTFTDGNGKVVAQNTVDAPAGSNADVVLHLTTAAGDPPVVTRFPNDMTGVPGDKASLTVAHTAAVPPADIRVDGKVLFDNVANRESLNLVVPVDLSVQGASLNRVYAVGDPAANTMNVAVHVLKVPETGSPQPTMVDTGSGGMAVVVQLIARIL